MKNKKINKNILILVVTIIILILVVVAFFILNKHEKTETKNEIYSKNAITTMNKLNIYDKINKLEYSKTIEVLLEENNFKTEYINEYSKINYQNINNFSNTINELLTKNYKHEEINYILDNFSNNLDIILNMEKINIMQFKDFKNFKLNNLERYIDYKNNSNYDLETVVTYVNIGLDLKGYSKYTSYTLEEAEDLSILVNKYHKLPDDYEPTDLVELSFKNGSYTYKLRSEAAEAFERLTSAALLDNVIIYPYSAYRSFKTQNVLYTRYKDRDGVELADTYSARPGFSEHQLGLAVDVRSNTLIDNLTEKDYKWMLDNSYKYGFIVRYPKGKQHITQFKEEPWHIRYLGTETATKVHDSNLTYDEYYDLYMEK